MISFGLTYLYFQIDWPSAELHFAWSNNHSAVYIIHVVIKFQRKKNKENVK